MFLSILFISQICFAQMVPNSIYNGNDGLCTARSYIQDGLINMWDAKENIGWGLHSNNTNVWKDLIGNRDMILESYDSSYATNKWWTDNSWVVNGAEGKSHGVIANGELPSSQTIQITAYPTKIFNMTSDTWKAARLFVGSYPAPAIYIYRSSGGFLYHVSWNAYEDSATRAFSDVGGTNNFKSLAPHQHTLMHEEDSPNVKYCIDGDTKYIYTITDPATIQNATNSSYLWIAGNASYSYGIDASYYCIRIYNRVLTDKELAWNYMIDSIRYGLPRKWYPYMNESWCWVDFTNPNMLRSDTGATVPAEIGDSVMRIKNQGGWNKVNWYGSQNALRTENGVCGYTNETGLATNVQLRSYSTLFTTNDDWNNIEFAMIVVAGNEKAKSFSGTASIMRTSQSRVLMLYYSNTALYYRTMQEATTGKSLGISRAKFGSDNIMYAVRTKSVNGEFSTKISINGTVVSNIVGQVPENFSYNFVPGICNSTSYHIMSSDYYECLVWDKIPEDWDLIEKALILKYDLKPFSTYYPNHGKPLLGGGFGGAFTGGDTEEPEEPEEPLDEEIEESE